MVIRKLFVLLLFASALILVKCSQCYTCIEHDQFPDGSEYIDYLTETQKAELRGLGFTQLTNQPGCRDNPDNLGTAYTCERSTCQKWDIRLPEYEFDMVMRGCDKLNLCVFWVDGKYQEEDPPAISLVSSQCYSCLEHTDFGGGVQWYDYISETQKAELRGVGFNHLTNLPGCTDDPASLGNTYTCATLGRQCQIWNLESPGDGFSMVMRGCDVLNLCAFFTDGKHTQEDPPGTITTINCCEGDFCNSGHMLQSFNAVPFSIVTVIHLCYRLNYILS